MKAVILKELNSDLAIDNVELTPLQYGQVLVKNIVSGLCGAQLQEIAGLKGNANFSIIAIGNKKTLNSLYLELKSISVQMFSKNNESFLKKQFKITAKHTDSIISKNPLADILVEKAAVLL